MTIEEAINVINAWIEPMRKTLHGTLAHEFLDAVEALRKQAISDKTSDKYAWHDLRKKPSDLPEEEKRVLTCSSRGFYEVGELVGTGWCRDLDEYATKHNDVIAWREIEPFE